MMVLSKKFQICAALYAAFNLAVCIDDIHSYHEAAMSGDHDPSTHSYLMQLPRRILQNETIDQSPVGALVTMAGISSVLLTLPGFYTGELIGRTAYKPAP